MLVYYSYVGNSNVVIVVFTKLQILHKLQCLACIFLSSDKEIRDLARMTELSSTFKIQCV